ncbi:MAG: RES family NAD+ phosphorylase [Cyclobacteriaceae bacterium]|nr:RES family NAD+ phosphorylase [Cyclobacteriaceae bacterium]
MILYHLEKWKYKDAWPPEGTLHAEGRWNKTGQWVIYTSPNIALAKLEILANENNLPIKRVCLVIEVPDKTNIYKVELKDLPDNWMLMPYPAELTYHTVQFLNKGYLLMRVPSAQSKREFNYLINVRHPDFYKQVKLKDVFEEAFDKRLRKVP